MGDRLRLFRPLVWCGPHFLSRKFLCNYGIITTSHINNGHQFSICACHSRYALFRSDSPRLTRPRNFGFTGTCNCAYSTGTAYNKKTWISCYIRVNSPVGGHFAAQAERTVGTWPEEYTEQYSIVIAAVDNYVTASWSSFTLYYYGGTGFTSGTVTYSDGTTESTSYCATSTFAITCTMNGRFYRAGALNIAGGAYAKTFAAVIRTTSCISSIFGHWRSFL